jgi:hypothetical protein
MKRKYFTLIGNGIVKYVKEFSEIPYSLYDFMKSYNLVSNSFTVKKVIEINSFRGGSFKSAEYKYIDVNGLIFEFDNGKGEEENYGYFEEVPDDFDIQEKIYELMPIEEEMLIFVVSNKCE